MSDIWSVGDSSAGSVDKLHASEDWDCGSDSSEEDQPPRKRTKKGNNQKPRPPRVIPTLDSSQPKAEDLGGEEDDLLAYLATTATTPPAQQGRKGRKGKKDSTVVLLDDDDLGLEESIAAAVGSRPVNGCSPDPVRLAALKQRALQEKLTQAQHAGEENDDDEVQLLDSEDDGDLPLPAAGSLMPSAADEDPALLLLQELDDGAANTAAAGGGAGGDTGKLPLVFQAQAHDSVTVRVQADQPLKHALETFTKYAADNGWGRVTKFMFDGERLTDGDTPEDLGMDADDVIDVYLDS